MAITKKLIKLGNSYGIIIERPVLDLLGINVDTLLEISTPDGIELVIKPVKSSLEAESKLKFKNALAQINEQFAPALKKLAE